MRRSESRFAPALLGMLACFAVLPQAGAADPGRSILPQLQDRFGLSESQVRGALGALLVFLSDSLPKPEFEQVARSIPNAKQIMRDTRLNGIVTKPLDDIHEYERSLESLGIGEPLASQFAPAVIEYLGAAGFYQEQDILRRVIR